MSDHVVCGWRLRSEAPLPELADWCGDDRPVDIHVRLAETPPPSPRAVSLSPRLQIEPDGAGRLTVEDVATFLVRDGCEVSISALQVRPDDQALRVYLLGTVLVLICHQRGLLPLHGSCVRWDAGGAVAALGVSGAGKSTLAAALRRTGRMVLGDDVCVLEMRDGMPIVRPAFPRVKLWRGALPIAGLESDMAVAADETQGKHHFRFTGADAFDPAPTPLKALYLLSTADPGGRAAVEDISPVAARLEALRPHVPRRRFAFAAGRRTALLNQLFGMAAVTPVRRLVRCAEPERIAETLAVLSASMEPRHDAAA